MKIQPIVEGHGDVKALPVLLRRLVQEAHVAALSIGRPIRRPRSKLVKKEGVQQAVRLALLQPECGAVLVLFDGESDCPADLGPTVQTWATAAADGTPCQVVLAHREYEAWFLAAIESLRGRRGVLIDAARHPDPERHRGAKEQLESRMQHTRRRATWKPRINRRSPNCSRGRPLTAVTIVPEAGRARHPHRILPQSGANPSAPLSSWAWHRRARLHRSSWTSSICYNSSHGNRRT